MTSNTNDTGKPSERGWPCDGCGDLYSLEGMESHDAGAGFGMVLCPRCSESENEEDV